MVPDRQKVWTDGQKDGRRQTYIPPTSSGDKKDLKDKWKLNEGRKYFRMLSWIVIIGLENQFWSSC